MHDLSFNTIVKPPVLRQERIAVISEGDLVAITIGNSTLRLQYEDALKLSQWIRMRAKQSKRRVGDSSRHWSAIAVIDGLDHNGEPTGA